MPNDRTQQTAREQRIRASWRTRACAAGLCVGAQIFLAGCAVGMPLALSSAWLAALPALLLCAWLVLRSRRALLRSAQTGFPSRAGYALLALSLLACASFALASVTVFAAQTLMQQARAAWIASAAMIAAALCALSGGTGAARLCFALRYALPLLVLGLSLLALPLRVPVGLFPILGSGAEPLGMAAAAMLFGAAPALMLTLPPPELAGMGGEEIAVPDARFFLWRVLAGALAGGALLFLSSACTTYESIAESSEWGARLRMAAGNQPHEGVAQLALTLSKLIAMMLLAVNALCAAQQALAQAFPRLRKGRAGLWILLTLLAACLAALVILGERPLLIAAPAIVVPAAMAAILLGRRNRG
ncbi:MAG: hypothetical protein IJ313_03235 [Clostridia bacterium]|nr:hypothetical protein [Clostridia bacterium]